MNQGDSSPSVYLFNQDFSPTIDITLTIVLKSATVTGFWFTSKDFCLVHIVTLHDSTRFLEVDDIHVRFREIFVSIPSSLPNTFTIYTQNLTGFLRDDYSMTSLDNKAPTTTHLSFLPLLSGTLNSTNIKEIDSNSNEVKGFFIQIKGNKIFEDVTRHNTNTELKEKVPRGYLHLFCCNFSCLKTDSGCNIRRNHNQKKISLDFLLLVLNLRNLFYETQKFT